MLRWRRIVGSYQITVPVRRKQVMLPNEMRLLSVLRRILQSVPTDGRWYPVFSRHVGLIGDLGDLGGDVGSVDAWPEDTGGAPAATSRSAA